MKSTSNEKDVRLTLQILPPKLWPRVEETSRLRVENIFMRSIEEGFIDPYTGNLDEGKGALGTWARDYVQYFKLKIELCNMFIQKLNQPFYERAYISRFFMKVLPFACEIRFKRDQIMCHRRSF